MKVIAPPNYKKIAKFEISLHCQSQYSYIMYVSGFHRNASAPPSRKSDITRMLRHSAIQQEIGKFLRL